jgi:hypothetical protein
MSTPEEFARECAAAAKALRRIPRELRKSLAAEVKDEIAVPLAAKIGGAARGPYGPALSGSVKARAAADPQIVIGGSKKIVSGGASARQLIYGTEFGGGKRMTAVPATSRHKGYKKASTNQFRVAHPFVFPTVEANAEWVLEEFADITLKIINQEMEQ